MHGRRIINFSITSLNTTVPMSAVFPLMLTLKMESGKGYLLRVNNVSFLRLKLLQRLMVTGFIALCRH